MAQIVSNNNEKLFRLDNFYGVNESPDGDTGCGWVKRRSCAISALPKTATSNTLWLHLQGNDCGR